MTDQQLLRQYLAGDGAAMERLIRRHIDMVYGTARRQVGERADDVTQAVYHLFIRKCAGLVGRESCAGWLYRATGYCCANLRKAEARRRKHEQEAAMMSPPASVAAAEANRHELRELLDLALTRLPGADREAILLRHLEQKSYAQAAERLGISEEAARKKADRGLEKLRQYFGAKGFAVPAAAVAGVMASEAAAHASAGLVGATVAMAQSAAVPAAVAALSKSIGTVMWWTPVKVGTAVAAGLLLLISAAMIPLMATGRGSGPTMGGPLEGSMKVGVMETAAAEDALAGVSIVRVDVAGNSRVDAAAVLKPVRSQKGAKYDRAVVDGDVRAIAELGEFTTVRAEAIALEGDAPGKLSGVVLRFVVEEKPAAAGMAYTHVTVDFDNATADEAARVFGAATRLQVTIDAANLTAQGVTLPPLTMHAHDVPLLEAVFQLARLSESRVTAFSATQLALGASAADRQNNQALMGPWSVSGPFGYEVVGLDRSTPTNGGAAQTTLRMRVYSQPQTNVVSFPNALEVGKFADDKGQAITFVRARGGATNAMRATTPMATLIYPLVLPQNPGRKIATFSGSAGFTLAGPTEMVKTTGPDEHVTKHVGDFDAEILPMTHMTLQGATLPSYFMQIRYHRGAMDAAMWAALLPSLHLRPPVVYDRAGHVLSAHPTRQVKESDDDYLVEFRAAGPPPNAPRGAVTNGEPDHYDLEIPTGDRTVSAAFSFSELPLP